MRITSATNTRTAKASLINFVAGESNTPILFSKFKYRLLMLLNSFVFDYLVRLRCGGLTLDYHFLKDIPVVKSNEIPKIILIPISRLSIPHIRFSIDWMYIRSMFPFLNDSTWKSFWAITPHERLRINCVLDAIVAELYKLDYEDYTWILKEDTSDPKGFWRIDKDKPIELRKTTLTLQAFKRLKEVGLDAFCKEDWQFPKEIQEKLGPRFLPWQLGGTPEESWEECKQHAKNILGEEKYKQFIDDLNNPEKDIETRSFSDKNNENKKLQKSIFSWGDKK